MGNGEVIPGDDLVCLTKRGVKMDAEDIIDWGRMHPEEAGKMKWAFLKDRGIGEHNLGEVVGWLVEKGAKITKTGVFFLQATYHCFSGAELADISSNGKIKFTAFAAAVSVRASRRLLRDVACGGGAFPPGAGRGS